MMHFTTIRLHFFLFFLFFLFSSSQAKTLINYSYDSNGRLIGTEYNHKSLVEYQYDKNGNKVSQKSTIDNVPCPLGSLDQQFKMHLPVVSLSLDGKQYLLAIDLDYFNQEGKHFFEITNYNLVDVNTINPSCPQSSLSSILTLHIPNIVYQNTQDTLSFTSDLRYAPHGSRLIFELSNFHIR